MRRIKNKILLLVSSLLACSNGTFAAERSTSSGINLASVKVRRNELYDTRENKNKSEKASPTWKKILKFVVAAGGISGTAVSLRKIANRVLFRGPTDDYISKFNEKTQDYICKSISCKSKRLGINLYGHSITYGGQTEYEAEKQKIGKICIYFYGNAENSKKIMYDFACDAVEKHKDTLFISFDYPLEQYLENCYKGETYNYGKDALNWNMMNENELRIFAEDVLSYVVDKYVKDKDIKPKISVAGFSLGGFPASCLANSNEVSSMYLMSPVCLPTFKPLKWAGKAATYPLFGYHLNSIENLINAKNRKDPLNLVLSSGWEYDICSLGDSIPYTLRKSEKWHPSNTVEEALRNSLFEQLPDKIELKKLAIDWNHDMNHQINYIDDCLLG